MEMYKILSLLNATANDLVPELKLEFRPCPQQLTVVAARICLGGMVAFDKTEIERCKDSSKGLARLFLERCIDTQTDVVILTAQTLKDLRYQLGALT